MRNQGLGLRRLRRHPLCTGRNVVGGVLVLVITTWLLVNTMKSLRTQVASKPSSDGASSNGGRTTITIWPLGDSITNGAGVDLSHTGGFRLALIQDLLAANLEPVLFGSAETDPSRIPSLMDTPTRRWHDGHNGYLIRDPLMPLPSWLDKSPSNKWEEIHPDYITVMLGTNDLSAHYSRAMETDGAEVMKDEEVLRQMGADLRRLLDEIMTLRPQAHILLASIVPAYWVLGLDPSLTGDGPEWPGPGAPLDRTDYLLNHFAILYNAFIQNTLIPELNLGLAGKGGSKLGGGEMKERISFVDVYNEFIGEGADRGKVCREDLYSDPTHPNIKGYGLIGKVFAERIVEIEERKRMEGRFSPWVVVRGDDGDGES